MSLWIGLIVAVVLLVLLGRYALNGKMMITRYDLEARDLPKAFDGWKIAQLSDTHGEKVEGLIEAIQKFQPDVILLTGDIYDGIHGEKSSDDLIEKILKIAPVFMVSGNHEYYLSDYPSKREWLKNKSVHLLENEVFPFYKREEFIEIAGVDDPDLEHTWNAARREEQLSRNLNALPDKQQYRILLSHRADLFPISEKAQPDLVLSGHLHGGHWRFFNHGFLQPNNGDGLRLFPKYDGGCYEEKGSVLIVSRGLGDQLAVPRLFNRPELVEITLHASNQNKQRK